MSSTLPVRAAGWRILVEPVEIKRTTAGGIELPPEAIRAQEFLRYFGKVVDVGTLAYHDEKFKEHANREPQAWCKVGDHIAFGRHAGQEIGVKVGGELKKLRLLNDDDVLAVIDDPAALQVEF